VRSARKDDGDYEGQDLCKRKVLRLEWNRDGVMHSERGDDDGDDDEPVRER